jgi:hypothetical protein
LLEAESAPRFIVRLEELGQLKKSTYSELELATSGFYYSVSTNYATACPIIVRLHDVNCLNFNEKFENGTDISKPHGISYIVLEGV